MLNSEENRGPAATEAILIRRKHGGPIVTGSYGYGEHRISSGNVGDNIGGFSVSEGADDGLDKGPAQVPPTPLNSVVVGSDPFIASLAASNAPPQAIKRLLEFAVSQLVQILIEIY